MNHAQAQGRLSRLAAALVVARRDFSAILFSRSFFFFLLGPIFPVLVGAMAGGVGQRVQQTADRPALGIAMEARDAAAVVEAGKLLSPRLGASLPELVVVKETAPGETIDSHKVLAEARGNVGALLSGTPQAPVLTGFGGQIKQWSGPVSLLAAQAASGETAAYPKVELSPTLVAPAKNRRGLLLTAQAGQTLLFLLTMLLAGMVLSNLVEEKGNKIIEILAAAIPMDSVFMGKLFAMLAVSFVGIAVWGMAAGGFMLVAGQSMPDLPAPAVGWPLFLGLGVAYFAMAYLLLGSVFLTIGSMAATVREVQTLSMPVTMVQLMVFFLASYAMTQPGSPVEIAAVVLPLSSPFAMLARAAQDPALWPHAAALAWQAVWVTLFVRGGAHLFRTLVMKSGGGGGERKQRRGLFARRPAPATA